MSVTKKHELFSELYAPVPLIAILVFALNNFYLKAHYESIFIGKISDITVCLFLPFLIAGVLDLVSYLTHRSRLVISCTITAGILISINSSVFIADRFDGGINAVLGVVGMQSSPTVVDPYDLVSLPVLVFAYWYGIRRGG